MNKVLSLFIDNFIGNKQNIIIQHSAVYNKIFLQIIFYACITNLNVIPITFILHIVMHLKNIDKN